MAFAHHGAAESPRTTPSAPSKAAATTQSGPRLKSQAFAAVGSCHGALAFGAIPRSDRATGDGATPAAADVFGPEARGARTTRITTATTSETAAPTYRNPTNG